MDPSILLRVLAQGEEQARRLEAELDGPDPESCRAMAREVLSSFGTAIAMARHLAGPSNAGGSDSGGSESPRSDGSEGVRARAEAGEQREMMMMMCKKRKSLPKWSNQVKVTSCFGGGGGGVEGSLDDGYCWRKYGQKDILGAKFPRCYYRCTHRNSRGCQATKHVQRSDDDPTVFDISYRGEHTCAEKPHKVQASSPPSNEHLVQYNEQLALSLRESLTVKTDGLEVDGGGAALGARSSSFSFPPTPASGVQHQTNPFFSPPMNNHHFGGPFSSTFMSDAAASELAYLSGQSQHQMSSYAAGPSTVRASEPEMMTSSPMMNMGGFELAPGEFDPSFHFDDPSFF